MADRCPFFRHSLSPAAAGDVQQVLSGTIITTGEVSRAVEGQLRDFFGIDHALLSNSWTNGAIATLLALGIGPGDEVIVPAMTFVATANVVEVVGATAVFVDVDPETLLMEAPLAASAITERTKAIIPVHLYGQMCDMAAYADLAAAHPDVAIIEDAAHAFESRRDGIPPGAASDAAIFSFYATKNVTCAEGGAVITRREDLVGWVGETRLHGMSAGAADRFREGQYRHWDMMRLGTKANLPDVLAALLPEQIRGVFDRLAQREALAERYESALASTGVTTPRVLPDSVHAHHLFPVHVPPEVRDEALFRLGAARVGATVNYHAVPTTAYYGQRFPDAAERFPVSVEWGAGTFTLPLFPGMRDEEMDYVIEVLDREIIPLAASGAR